MFVRGMGGPGYIHRHLDGHETVYRDPLGPEILAIGGEGHLGWHDHG